MKKATQRFARSSEKHARSISQMKCHTPRSPRAHLCAPSLSVCVCVGVCVCMCVGVCVCLCMCLHVTQTHGLIWVCLRCVCVCHLAPGVWIHSLYFSFGLESVFFSSSLLSPSPPFSLYVCVCV